MLKFFISPNFADLEAHFPSLKDATLFILCGSDADLHRRLLKYCRDSLPNSNNLFLFLENKAHMSEQLVGIYEKERGHFLLDGNYFGIERANKISRERPVLLFSTDTHPCQSEEKEKAYAAFLYRIFAGESLRHYAETHF